MAMAFCLEIANCNGMERLDMAETYRNLWKSPQFLLSTDLLSLGLCRVDGRLLGFGAHWWLAWQRTQEPMDLTLAHGHLRPHRCQLGQRLSRDVGLQRQVLQGDHKRIKLS